MGPPWPRTAPWSLPPPGEMRSHRPPMKATDILCYTWQWPDMPSAPAPSQVVALRSLPRTHRNIVVMWPGQGSSTSLGPDLLPAEPQSAPPQPVVVVDFSLWPVAAQRNPRTRSLLSFPPVSVVVLATLDPGSPGPAGVPLACQPCLSPCPPHLGATCCRKMSGGLALLAPLATDVRYLR